MRLCSLNAQRASNPLKLQAISSFLCKYYPDVVIIQEIHVVLALQQFSSLYQVFINIEDTARDNIGIAVFVKRNIKVLDKIISKNGRIIGIKVGSCQIWNIYPKSGSQNRNIREVFFRDDLTSLYELWKDSTSFSLVGGDFNCIHNKGDSLNNPQVHLQPALVKFMQTYNLEDDYMKYVVERGDGKLKYSRVTKISSTRIDFTISSSAKSCMNFEYIDIPNFDHRFIFAEFDVELSKINMKRKDFQKSWVIPKLLENDELFMDLVNNILEKIKEEKDQVTVNDSYVVNPSIVWATFKDMVIYWAKIRYREIKRELNESYERYLHYYALTLKDMSNDVPFAKEELLMLVREMDFIYRSRLDNKIHAKRFLEIRDNNFDLNKAEKEKKFIDGSRIEKLKLNEKIFTNQDDIMEAIYNEMAKELNEFSGDSDIINNDSFLNLIPEVEMSEDEKKCLEGIINENEVERVLQSCESDSGPGLDGITYRFIKVFWKNKIFREIYVDFLNHIKDTGDYGPVKNIGVMKIKNKRESSIEYSKKRKLTLLNKDLNLLGKIFSDRFKIVLDRILPMCQFVCRSDVNIVDELVILRDVNYFLQGNKKQRNGSILSIDFHNAFRSTSLKWFKSVIIKLGLPKKFIDFFFNLYNDLSVVINVNNCITKPIRNMRGFMEGHPPSMQCFVVAITPFMIAMQNHLKGIQIDSQRKVKMLSFADDCKIVLREPGEVVGVYRILENFEKCSGIRIHKDRSRGKCNILTFGNHNEVIDWPFWVNKVEKMKVIGAFFSVNENIEKLNSDVVKTRIISKLFSEWGMKGTILSRVYYVNTFVLTKMNYIAQAFKIRKDIWMK